MDVICSIYFFKNILIEKMERKINEKILTHIFLLLFIKTQNIIFNNINWK